MTARESLRRHLEAAHHHATDDNARAHLEAAIETTDDLSPTPLVECPVCGRVGLPERIRIHDCPL